MTAFISAVSLVELKVQTRHFAHTVTRRATERERPLQPRPLFFFGLAVGCALLFIFDPLTNSPLRRLDGWSS